MEPFLQSADESSQQTQMSSSQLPEVNILTNTDQKPTHKFKFLITILSALIIMCVVVGFYMLLGTKMTSRTSVSQVRPNLKKVQIPVGWKTNECKYDGYKISYPPEMTPHIEFPGEGSCAYAYGYSSIESPIKVFHTNQSQIDGKTFQALSEKEVLIDGIKAKYMQIREVSTKTQYLVYEILGNNLYYYVRLELNYQNPMQEMDFYKDSNWGDMVNAYNKAIYGTPSATPTQEDMVNIFQQIAQTFVLTPLVPTPTPYDYLLRNCLDVANSNKRKAEDKTCKPTGKLDGSCTIENSDMTIILQQFYLEANKCYRSSYPDSTTNDCLKNNLNDPKKEWDCYSKQISRQITGF